VRFAFLLGIAATLAACASGAPGGRGATTGGNPEA
jgi:hypothetical protein